MKCLTEVGRYGWVIKHYDTTHTSGMYINSVTAGTCIKISLKNYKSFENDIRKQFSTNNKHDFSFIMW